MNAYSYVNGQPRESRLSGVVLRRNVSPFCDMEYTSLIPYRAQLDLPRWGSVKMKFWNVNVCREVYIRVRIEIGPV